MTQKSILVTGGSGFIGHHLIPKLLDNGYTISATTRDKKKFAKYIWRNDISLIETDLLNFDISSQTRNFEGVIHLAWDDIIDVNSLTHFEKHLYQSYIFLKKLVQSGVSKVFVAGTCLEYGMQNGALAPQTQCSPITAYGFAKHTLYQKLCRLQLDLGFQLIWGRLFYMYGEGQSSHCIIPQLDQAIDNNLAFFNMSFGEQLRDYLCVSQVVKQIVYEYESKSSSVVNICSGNPISIRTLVERHIMERNSDIKLYRGYYPYNHYEPMAFWGLR